MKRVLLVVFMIVLFVGCIEEPEVSEPLSPEEYQAVTPSIPEKKAVKEIDDLPEEDFQVKKENRDVFFANLSLKIVPTFSGKKLEDVKGEMEVRLKDVLLGKKANVYYYVNINREVEGEEESVEKRGVYEAISFADSKEVLPPWYWKGGKILTKTGLIWLSKDSFLELKTSGSTKIKFNFVGGSPNWYMDKVGEDFFDLIADSEFVYVDLMIEGEMQTVRCLKAKDSLGNEYLILDNVDNPLILKLTYAKESLAMDGIVGLNKILKNMAGYEIIEVTVDYSPLDPNKFGV